MLGKGCLIVMGISILAMLGACGVLFAQQCAKEPPEGTKIIEVRNQAGQLIDRYLAEESEIEKDGDVVILKRHYAWNGSEWVYHGVPLKITPKWGKVIIIDRR